MPICDCDRNGISVCNVIAIVLGIIAGVVVALLFAAELIPTIGAFVVIALIAAVIGIFVLLGSLFTANLIKGNNSFYKCTCRYAKYVLAGTIGTLIAGTLAAVSSLATTSIAVTILIALLAFFFVLLVVTLICLLSCIIEQTCKCKYDEN